MAITLLNPGCGDDDCYPCDGGEDPCFCTDIPTSVTFTGATGCLSVMNGTFALAASPTGDLTICPFTYSVIYELPENGCSGASCLLEPNVWKFLYLLGASVWYNKVDATCIAYIRTVWAHYFSSGGFCYGSPPDYAHDAAIYFSRLGCTTGTMGDPYSPPVFDVRLGTPPTACTIAF